MFYRIGCLCLLSVSLFSAEHVYLKTPNLAREEIIGTNAGIRPHRKNGVRIEAEKFADKLIIHNYGYGGSGVTLCFGGSKEVLEVLEEQKISSKSVAVLGAGVVGLATAYDLLEAGYEVRLYADSWSPHLTSNVAAGIWTPLIFPYDMPEEKKKHHQWLVEISEERYLKSTSKDPEFSGVRQLYCYNFTPGDSREGEEVIVHFDNGTLKNGRRTYELGIDGKLFLEDLYSKVKEKGAVLNQKSFKTLDDVLGLEEEVMVNCMSLGSREIFDDQNFIPTRGQLIYFKPQNEIDYFLFEVVTRSSKNKGAIFVNIYPTSDKLILGGVYEIGEEAPCIQPETIEKMFQNGEKCLSGELGS